MLLKYKITSSPTKSKQILNLIKLLEIFFYTFVNFQVKLKQNNNISLYYETCNFFDKLRQSEIIYKYITEINLLDCEIIY